MTKFKFILFGVLAVLSMVAAGFADHLGLWTMSFVAQCSTVSFVTLIVLMVGEGG